jgi:predicted small secreted protein
MNISAVLICAVMLILISLMSLSGCNTWDGAGKDVESAGKGMQKD